MEKTAGNTTKKTSIAIIAVVLVILLIGVGAFVAKESKKRSSYKTATALQNNGEYESAINAYRSLGDYKDCPDRLEECLARLEEQQNAKISKAEQLIDNAETYDDYDEAEKLLNEVGNEKANALLDQMYRKVFESCLEEAEKALDSNFSLVHLAGLVKVNYAEKYGSAATAEEMERLSQCDQRLRLLIDYSADPFRVESYISRNNCKLMSEDEIAEAIPGKWHVMFSEDHNNGFEAAFSEGEKAYQLTYQGYSKVTKGTYSEFFSIGEYWYVFDSMLWLDTYQNVDYDYKCYSVVEVMDGVLALFEDQYKEYSYNKLFALLWRGLD